MLAILTQMKGKDLPQDEIDKFAHIQFHTLAQLVLNNLSLTHKDLSIDEEEFEILLECIAKAYELMKDFENETYYHMNFYECLYHAVENVTYKNRNEDIKTIEKESCNDNE